MDEIRERHGMQCADDEAKATSVTIHETDSFIYIDGGYHPRRLTPEQARYLAKQLLRLARRIEERS
jgi:hypothetical protein